HDRRRIGIDENDPIALGTQRFASLSTGIIEFASLPYDDRACSDDQDRRKVCPLRHFVVLTTQHTEKAAFTPLPKRAAPDSSALGRTSPLGGVLVNANGTPTGSLLTRLLEGLSFSYNGI